MFQHEIVDVTNDSLPFKVILHKNTSAAIRRHWHRSFELSYTLEGEIGEFIISGHTYRPTKGTILVINPNEIHSIFGSATPGHPTIALSLLIPYPFMEKHIPDFAYRHYQIPEKEKQTVMQQQCYAQLENLLRQLFVAADTSDTLQQLLVTSRLYEILYLLTKAFSKVLETKNDLMTISEEFDWIDKVLSYIRQHLSDSLSVNQLAKAFHLTDSYFSRKFTKYMGLSVMAYVTELRLQEAFYLLTNTTISIQAITDQCGFANHKALITAFKKRYGNLPSQYRKKLAQSHKSTKN